jgi:hypothetical protein
MYQNNIFLFLKIILIPAHQNNLKTLKNNNLKYTSIWVEPVNNNFFCQM